MLLIHPPIAKPGEPPAGIAQLSGALRGHNLPCTLLDASLEGLLFLLTTKPTANDTWSRRACRNIADNLTALRTDNLYHNFDRYQRAVSDVNRVLEISGRPQISLSLANYQDSNLSPLKKDDLLQAAEDFKHNIFFPYFAPRLEGLLAEKQPSMIGISLNYLSQAVCSFAMIGYIKKHFAHLPVVLGGGLVTSWLRNPTWNNPFAGLVDHLIAGPGEEALLVLHGVQQQKGHFPPDFTDLPLTDYLAPGFILPYAASSGCYWNKCSFCPEKAEENPYVPLAVDRVLTDIDLLTRKTRPRLLHFLDNAISPTLLRSLVEQPPATPWYGFARISRQLADHAFCRALRKSGCLMLKLGLESGDQSVLDSMNKGIDLELASQVFAALQQANIATYVYLLFGTPTETEDAARRTKDFIVRHSEAITFVNLAVFNMPLCGPDAQKAETSDFYQGDLSLYTDFIHPNGWTRKKIRRFLDQEFKRHPAIADIVRRDPPLFTSNHAPFFTGL